MIINLPENIDHSINAAVRSGRFATVDDAMTEAARLLLHELGQAQAPVPTAQERQTPRPQAGKPIWEIIEEENQGVPPEVWDDLPTDLSSEHDHYLYGTPKQHEA